jgi:DNA-binding CsgD family transcriptional regulator
MRSAHQIRGGVVKLTPAEAAVVSQVVRGLTNKEVARALRKSDLTVKNQLTAVYRKLGVKRRFQLIAQFRA